MGNSKIISETQLRKIIREKLENNNNQLNIRVASGYGASHPYTTKKSTNLGQTGVEDYLLKHPEKQQKEEDQNLKPVEISRAFAK